MNSDRGLCPRPGPYFLRYRSLDERSLIGDVAYILLGRAFVVETKVTHVLARPWLLSNVYMYYRLVSAVFFGHILATRIDECVSVSGCIVSEIPVSIAQYSAASLR